MLVDYPLDALFAFLKSATASELTATSPELPRPLTKIAGRNFLFPVAWLAGGHVILHFPPTFPDVVPKVFLPRDAARPALLPHLNRLGEICCFDASTVVNPQDALGIVQATIAKAEAVWTRKYSRDEFRAEVEAEYTAYWEMGENGALYLSDGGVVHARVLRVIAQRLAQDRVVHWVAELDPTRNPPDQIVLVVELARDRTLEFLTDPVSTLCDHSSLRETLDVFCEFLGRGFVHKRHFTIWILVACPLSSGMVHLALVNPTRLSLDLRKTTDLNDLITAWLKRSPLQRVRVQDMRAARLQRRTAGLGQASGLDTARLALIGCGSLGGFLADGLVRAGATSWLFVDTDLLRPENLARHLLGFEYIYQTKTDALAAELKLRFPDLDLQLSHEGGQTESGRKRLNKFGPTLTLSATGDTNSDLTLSESCRKGRVGDCCFLWVEPNLAAGHLVFQPSGHPAGLHDLHEAVGTGSFLYRHRLLTDPRALLQTEAGCQVAFTPYSGADMQAFAYSAAQEVRGFLTNRPTTLTVRRFTRAGWERILG